MFDLSSKLHQPCPLPDSSWRGIISVVMVGVVVTCLLLLLSPFNIRLDRPDALIFILTCGFSAIASGILVITSFPRTFPNLFKETRWNVLHQIGYELVYFTFIGIALLMRGSHSRLRSNCTSAIIYFHWTDYAGW